MNIDKSIEKYRKKSAFFKILAKKCDMAGSFCHFRQKIGKNHI
jgi:hypothetical protein